MTRTRYGIAVVLQSFGLFRKMKRMTDAAAELHLMQEGEEILGALCWEHIEQIEDLSMEYWNIRKISGERLELAEKIKEAEIKLHAAQEERAARMDQNKESGQEMFNQREDLFDEIEDFNTRREEIMEEAMAVKRRHEALKVKIGVLKEEGKTDDPSYSDTAREVTELRTHFSTLKEKLATVDQQIDEKQKALTEIQTAIDEKHQHNKSDVSNVYALISRANRDISSHRAKLGLLAEEQGKLCRQVGRHLNIHHRDKKCKNACKNHRDLLEQVKFLRRSIQWNKNLIAKAGG